ncbi:MAG TPA: sensor histidine kinase [Burkholderiaceae bacterium]|jgi:signal transduction histidine kinase|nr:sensor histidine kinase [Burkholderiaceae bacterium]
MNVPSARLASWSVVAAVTALLAAIGIFVGWHIDGAIDTATRIARPHEVQTALEHSKGTLDALQDSVQDYLIDGADGMRYQYEDAVRSLASQAAELSAGSGIAMAANDMEQIDRHMKEVLTTSRAVIDSRNSARPETLRSLAEASTAAVNGARRHLDTLIAAQQEALQQRERTLRQDVAQMYGGLVAAAAIVVCVVAGAVIVVDFDRRRSVALQGFLRSENERLEGAVRERSATLAEANRELTWFSKRALQIQEQERRSLALELHDQIGQELASLVLSLTRCEREMETAGVPGVRSAVKDSIEIARAAYGDVHNLALDLRPAMLDRLGLIPTLQWFARQQAKHSGCEIVVEADAFPVILPSDVLIAAFRIVQEAVSNAVRHAAPRRIEIQARYRPARIELQVSDDGAGFDLGQGAGQHEPRVGLGLIGMRQRAQDVGGDVSIRSAPGSGTQVIALLPLPPTA